MRTIIKLCFVVLIIGSLANCLEFAKNKNIVSSEKGANSNVIKVTELVQLTSRAIKNKENSIVIFYADWCGHW